MTGDLVEALTTSNCQKLIIKAVQHLGVCAVVANVGQVLLPSGDLRSLY